MTLSTCRPTKKTQEDSRRENRQSRPFSARILPSRRARISRIELGIELVFLRCEKFASKPELKYRFSRTPADRQARQLRSETQSASREEDVLIRRTGCSKKSTGIWPRALAWKYNARSWIAIYPDRREAEELHGNSRMPRAVFQRVRTHPKILADSRRESRERTGSEWIFYVTARTRMVPRLSRPRARAWRLNVSGNKCTYVGASFSRLWSYYALTCLGPDPATVRIYNNDHQVVLNWTNNAMVRELLTERLIPQRRDFNITVNGYDSRVRLLLPHDFNENESYPLLVHVWVHRYTRGRKDDEDSSGIQVEL